MEKHYAEKFAYMPNYFQPHDHLEVVSDKVFTREELGLPTNGFVYCSFNRVNKIEPDVFSAWMEILTQVC